jgi:membrane-bound inhibitor of C-type lysozyme
MNRSFTTTFLAIIVLAASATPAGAVKALGPVTYICGDGTRVTATYLETDPPTASIAVNDSKPALATIRETGSGARYANERLSLWEHQGVARIEIKGQKPRECPLKR